MSDVIEHKLGNPKTSFSRNEAILSHPQNFPFFEDEIFKKKFLLIWFESAKMKFRPYFTMELVKKLMKKT